MEVQTLGIAEHQCDADDDQAEQQHVDQYVLAIVIVGVVYQHQFTVYLQEDQMRDWLAILAASGVALSLFAYPAAAQSCGELRRACEMKDSLGEVGQGNCAKYREQCGGRQRVDCRSLRAACMYKGEAGQVGQGNCRRYREACGGQ